MEKGKTKFFDIEKIHQNYQTVIADFDRINRTINSARDQFDHRVAGNLLKACSYINERLASAPKNAIPSPRDMLELNMIVHMGTEATARLDYGGFISYTEEKFTKYLPVVMDWYARNKDYKDNPYHIAAGVYVRILAVPQLFSDGNHRTGSLIANYYLLMAGKEPFIITCANAVEFFNLASDVKFKKRDAWSNFKRTIGWRDETVKMAAFLEANAKPFTVDLMPEKAESRPL